MQSEKLKILDRLNHSLVQYKPMAYYDFGFRCSKCSLDIYGRIPFDEIWFITDKDQTGTPIEYLNLSCEDVIIKDILE